MVPGVPSGDRGNWEYELFCEESLEKIKFRAFQEQFGPRILSLESVDYLGTNEHYSGRKTRRILISKTAMVGCCKLSLYAMKLLPRTGTSCSMI